MKARESIRIEKSTVNVSGDMANTIVKHVTNIRQTGKSKRAMEYPAGSIGRNLSQRSYVKYLVERYHRFRKADASFGRLVDKFSYAVIFKNIEREFDAPTFFVRESRFNELVAYLKRKVDSTILGKRNHAEGIRNYITFEEFVIEQEGDQAPRAP
jgi:hypothetical protein